MLGGVDIDLGQGIDAEPKKPLPTDFTKDIKLRRDEHDPQVMLRINDKTDEVQNPKTNENLYSVVETSTGAFLVPLGIIHKAKDTNGKIIIDDALNEALNEAQRKPVILGNNLPEESGSNIELKDTSFGKILSVTSLRGSEHCECCILYRMIVKIRQTTIKDFFLTNSKVEKKCPCKSIEFPKITNRLKVLVSNFGSNYEKVYVRLNNQLMELVNNKQNNIVKEELNDYNIDDKCKYSFTLDYRANRIETKLRKFRGNNAAL